DFPATLGRVLYSDPKRLQQILKNLLSNAMKFTERGEVRLSASVASSGWTPGHPVLDAAATVIAFEVSDTGIGISPEKQRIVFEAFQQADAGTSRKYGGTGLGLAISREISGLLGGELKLRSTVGEGSTFVLYIPLTYVGAERKPDAKHPSLPRHRLAADDSANPVDSVKDDRDTPNPDKPTLLVVEDDARYAMVIRDLAHARGFNVLVTSRGSEALRLVGEFKPDAISLDILLPDMLGWSVLAKLKQNADTRHIPVQIVSVEEERHHSFERGAFAYIAKPATTDLIGAALERIRQYTLPRTKKLLVVEDDADERMSIEALIEHDDVDIDTAADGAEALAKLQASRFDCVVLDMRLPDMSGFELIDHIQAQPDLQDIPLVVFTGKELTAEEDRKLQRAAKSVIVKGVESPERLLDETALFLHRI